MEFTSLLFLKTKEKGNKLLHLGLWVSVSSHGRSLAELDRIGEGRAAVFRRGEAPEVGARLGKMERSSSRTCRWSRWGLGGLWRAVRGRRRPATVLYRGCGTPARGRRLGWAWELRWGEVKPFPRFIGAVGGRRWKLRGGIGRGGANGGSGRRKAWPGAWRRDGE